MATQRKSRTSTEVKSRYNKKAYDRITVSVPKEMAATFKAKCASEGIPQAQIIKKAIENYISSTKE